MPAEIKFAIVLRCKRHPGYDPAIHGEAGIRGGCIACIGLRDCYIALREKLRVFTAEISTASAGSGFEARVNGEPPSHVNLAPLPMQRTRAKAAAGGAS